MRLDIYILQLLNSFATTNIVAQYIFTFLADNFDVIVVVTAILFLLIHDDFPNLKFFSRKELFYRSKEIIRVLLISGIAWGTGEIIKNLILIPRPFAVGLAKNLINYPFQMGSFPSGHAIFFISLGVAIYYKHKMAGIFFMICVALISISRVAVGIHYPSDILFGFIIGWVVALAFKKFINENPTNY